MESVIQSGVDILFIVHTSVLDVRIIDDQWFVHFDGSRESIALGHKSEPQPFLPNDHVEITFRKVPAPDAKPSSPPVQ